MSNDLRPDGRHRRREENRQKTLETALELILETGEFPDFELLAERTGISRRSIFHYFSSKDEMLLEVRKLYTSHIMEHDALPEADPERSLEETMLSYLDFRVRFNEGVTPLRQLMEERKRAYPQFMEYVESRRKFVLSHINELFCPYFPDAHEFEKIQKMLFCNASWNIWVVYRHEFKLSIEESRILLEKQMRALLGLV